MIRNDKKRGTKFIFLVYFLPLIYRNELSSLTSNEKCIIICNFNVTSTQYTQPLQFIRRCSRFQLQFHYVDRRFVLLQLTRIVTCSNRSIQTVLPVEQHSIVTVIEATLIDLSRPTKSNVRYFLILFDVTLDQRDFVINFSFNPLKQNARSNFLFVIYKYFLKSKIV